MKKAILATILMIFAGSASLSVAFSQTANAACASEGVQLFRIPAWYRGLVKDNCEIKKVGPKDKGGEVEIQEFIWTVVGNILDGLFRVIGLVTVGYIIWGGFQYMIAAGDSGKMAAAKNTITNALIGLVLSLVASSIVQLVMGVF